MRIAPASICVGLSVALSSAVAIASPVDIKFGGAIGTDLRFRLSKFEVPSGGEATPYPTQQRLLKYGFSRNENLIKAQLTINVANRVKAVGDVDFVFYGYSDINDLDAASLQERVDPYRLESSAGYIDIYRLLPGLDLRLGRQVVAWGTADKFNPTNNLNTLDLSDSTQFGRALGNQMIRLDYNPWKDLVFTLVWVPVFRPARLPRTARVALAQVERPPPLQDDSQRNALLDLTAIFPPTNVKVFALQPETNIQNSQVGFRVAKGFGGIDFSLSYYYGRFGLPVPAWSIFKPGGTVEIGVIWPRMQVLGFDMAGSIEKLGGLGYWLEVGVFFPQEVRFGIYSDVFGQRDPITFTGSKEAGYSAKIGGAEAERGIVIPKTPFPKVTFGVDYSFNKYVYANFQYVYGFIDEFGAGKQGYPKVGAMVGDRPRLESRLGHYFVLGPDIKVLDERLLIRLFGAFKIPQWDDPSKKFTAVLYPQLAYAVAAGTELALGAFIFLGDRSTKFGDPAAGATEIFLRGKFTY